MIWLASNVSMPPPADITSRPPTYTNVSSPSPPNRESMPSPPISVSLPSRPLRISLPSPPVRTLLAALPERVSFPVPPIAFSIVTPLAIEKLLVRPPKLENASSLKSMTLFEEKPDKSSVSMPPVSQTEPMMSSDAVFNRHLSSSELSVDFSAVELNP